MNLKNAKLFGGVGAILMVLALIPGLTTLLLIPGWLLLLSALNDISDITKNRDIISNYLMSVGILLGGIILLLVFSFSFIISLMGALISMSLPDLSLVFATGGGMSLLLALILFYLSIVVSSYYAFLAFQKTGKELNIDIFGSGGLLLFVGGAGVIIFGLGLVLHFIGLIFIAVGFFRIPDYFEPQQIS